MTEELPQSDKRWREIAKKVSTEQNPHKITELSQKLIEALDNQMRKPATTERRKGQDRRKTAAA